MFLSRENLKNSIHAASQPGKKKDQTSAPLNKNKRKEEEENVKFRFMKPAGSFEAVHVWQQ